MKSAVLNTIAWLIVLPIAIVNFALHPFWLMYRWAANRVIFTDRKI